MKKILFLILSAYTLAGCVPDGDIDPCPEPVIMGGVDVDIYVERFNGTLEWGRSAQMKETSEQYFGDRVENLYYMLYREGTLVEDGTVDKPSLIRTTAYVFKRDDMLPGNYCLYLMANCPDLEKKPLNPEDIAVLYPGHELTQDYFITRLPFEVFPNERTSYQTQLKRMHGVVRLTFYDLDPCITKIDVHMNGLTGSGSILGTYSEDYELNMSIPIIPLGRAEGDTQSVIGLFPTMEGGMSSWDVKVHRADGEPLYFEGVVSEDLSVLRNRLLDLRATFVNGGIVFDVSIDSEWDDANESGPSIVN